MTAQDPKRPRYEAGEGADLPMYEEGFGRVVLFAVVTGVVASLLAALIIWCFTGFAVPEVCRMFN